MATAARLLPSIKSQMALQTLPQFIFQGALRDHHLENNTSGKTKGRTEGFKITAKCSLLTIGSTHVMGWEGSTYPRWTSLSEPREVFLSTLYPFEIFTVRPRRRSLSFSTRPARKRTQAWLWFTATVKVRNDRRIHLLFMSLHPRHVHCWSGPNKRQVSTSCLLKLMFSWLEMNCPVMRIYLYSG